jgi:outer membrane protein insertion porin family
VLAAEVPSLFAGAAVLEDDIARAVLVLNAFYWDRGHANVRIVTPRLGAGRIPIEFAIDEGPVFRIGAISLTGDVVPADHAMLLSTFAVNTGDLFSRTGIVDGRAAVEKALSARGSTFEIVPLTKVDLANRTIDLTLEITRK